MKLDIVKLKKALPFIKGVVVLAANVNDSVATKHQDKVEKGLNKAYNAIETLERVL